MKSFQGVAFFCYSGNMAGKNVDKITDIVIPTLQKLQSGMAELQKDMGMVKEAIRRIDMRMGALEGHVSGIYSTSRYHSDELDDLRGRVESLEDNPDKPHE
jgi:hypothetical protein